MLLNYTCNFTQLTVKLITVAEPRIIFGQRGFSLPVYFFLPFFGRCLIRFHTQFWDRASILTKTLITIQFFQKILTKKQEVIILAISEPETFSPKSPPRLNPVAWHHARKWNISNHAFFTNFPCVIHMIHFERHVSWLSVILLLMKQRSCKIKYVILICNCTWLAGVFKVHLCLTSYGIVPVMALMWKMLNVMSQADPH